MVIDNINVFSFCPRCGKQGLQTKGEKAFLCPFCQFLFFMNPGAAVCAIITNSSGNLLVTKRKYDPFRNMLDLPGGFSDPGENIEACLKREVQEELGVEIEQMKYFCSYPSTYNFKGITYPVLDFAFLCRIQENQSIKAGDDVSEFYFIPLSEISVDQFGLHSIKQVLRRYLKYKNKSQSID